MSETPSDYDLIQDDHISALQGIVVPSYTPPAGPEDSFPKIGQGIGAEQYRQTNLTNGSGILHRFPETYYLDYHATAEETNQRNTLLLKVTRNNEPNAVAEATIHGYFHRMTQDMEIPMEPVLTQTDVYVTLTYDPREESSEQGPISVKTHIGSLPTTHNREHIIIARVEMKPNQLLSNTSLNRQRQYSSPVVYVPNHTTVPRSQDFLYGTTLLMGVNGRGRIMHNWSGNEGWNDLLVGEWVPHDFLFGGWLSSSECRVRHRLGGIDIVAELTKDDTSTSNQHRPVRLPEGFRPTRDAFFTVMTSRSPYHRTMGLRTNGEITIQWGGVVDAGSVYINTFIPDYYF